MKILKSLQFETVKSTLQLLQEYNIFAIIFFTPQFQNLNVFKKITLCTYLWQVSKNLALGLQDQALKKTLLFFFSKKNLKKPYYLPNMNRNIFK